MAAGRQRANPTRILSMGSMAQLVEQLRARADYVIFDTPPLLLSGDAFPLAQLADTVILACREGTTSREEAQALRRTLTSLDVTDYQIVMTESSVGERRGYGYEYGATTSDGGSRKR
jgi:Mrp family chromosome partitioning ATPase